MKTIESRIRQLLSVIGIALIFNAVMPAQTPTWQWARTAGSKGLDGAGFDKMSSTITTDAVGNSYVTGTINGDATFGTFTIPASGHSEVFVAKYSTSGQCLWVDHFGGSFTGVRENEGTGISIDGAGNCYVTATVSAKYGNVVAVFGTSNIVGTDHREICIVKYSSSGNRLWAIQPSTSGLTNNLSRSICCDAAGNSWTTGYAGSSIVFGSTLLGSGAFVIHCNPQGVIVWSMKLGDVGVDANSISATTAGKAWITGTMQGTCFVTSATNPTFSAIGTVDMFVAKLGTTGIVEWIQRYGAVNGITTGRGVRADNSGNALVIGDYDKPFAIGGVGLTKDVQVMREAYVCKISLTGSVVWAKQTHSSPLGSTAAAAITTAGNGDFAVCGTFNGNTDFAGASFPTSNVAQHCYVVKCTNAGIPLWTAVTSAPNTGLPEPHGLGRDALDNYYLSGNLQGLTGFGSTTAAPYGGYDVFVAKLGSNSSICGQKYLDVNCNGTRDSNDVALPQWVFQLVQQSTIIATSTSNDRGVFCFDNLSFGTYTVHEVPQNGYMVGTPPSGSYLVTIDSSHPNISGLIFLNCSTSVHRPCLDFEDANAGTSNWVTDNVSSATIAVDSTMGHVIQFVDGSGPSIAIDNNDFAGNWLTQGQNGCICFDYKVDWNQSQGSNAGSAPKLYIYTGAPISHTGELFTRLRAYFVGNTNLPPIGDNVWNHFCLPIETASAANILPFNEWGTWVVYGTDGTLITDPALAAAAWNSLISSVTGLVLCTDYNNEPSERVFFDNFCWECLPECHGDEVGSVVIDSTCCSGSIQIVNQSTGASFSPISGISYSVLSGGTVNNFSIVGACSSIASGVPTSFYGTTSGTINFASPYCSASSFYISIGAMSTAQSTAIEIRVQHANGSMCLDTVTLHCQTTSLQRCDGFSVSPADSIPIKMSGRRIDIQNLLLPASEIRWVRISTNTLPNPSGGQVQWRGSQLMIDGAPRTWIANGINSTGEDLSPGIEYSMIRLQNGFQELPACQSNMSFLLSMNYALGWSGQCTITVGHANGFVCEKTFNWCARNDRLCPFVPPYDRDLQPASMMKLLGGSFVIPGADQTKIRFASIAISEPKRTRFLGITAANIAYPDSVAPDSLPPAVVSSNMSSQGGMIEFRTLRSAKEGVELSYMLARLDSTDTAPVDLVVTIFDDASNPVATRNVQAKSTVTSVQELSHNSSQKDSPHFIGIIPSPVIDNGTIKFWAPSNQNIRVELYDILGDRVLILFDGIAREGVNVTNVSSASLVSGTYIVRITSNESVISAPMVVAH